MAKQDGKLDGKLKDLFEEKGEKIRCSLYLKESVHARVMEACDKSGKSLNQVVERILERFFEE